MKERFVDPETGWTVSREAVVSPPSNVAVIEETVTDPQTGEVYRSSRAASYSRAIADWVRTIEETKELIAPSKGAIER
jgi:hypothetical protein